MVKASPLAYRDPGIGTMLPGETITQMRNQFIGEEKGLRELNLLLTQRRAELEETIKKQDKAQ